MNETDLAREVAGRLNIPAKEADRVFDTYQAVITEALADGEPVTMHQFGRLDAKLYSARKGRNPRTGETIQIPAKRRAKFKAYSRLEAALNG